MGSNWVLAAVAAFVAGLVLYFKSDKERQENGEWSNALQWGYLLMMVGIFGVLSFFMSFTAVLLIFVLFTGVVWLVHKKRLKADAKHLDKGHFTDYMSGFFPIILVVFVLRTFIAEPFQIPSSSMRPGLVVGDFILVNKFSYGIRTPIVNNVLIPTGSVERGDVVVFNYPEQPSVNYIKRAIGLPGDVIEYKDKVLSINGKPLDDMPNGTYSYSEYIPQIGQTVEIQAEQFEENIGSHQFNVLKVPGYSSYEPAQLAEFSRQPFAGNCEYAADGSAFRCTVPEGHYFMMGDNRDNSSDSRYWGFVSDKLIVGKAFFIWMNFNDFGRIGTMIR
ncbi:signal peptidase I [Neisseria animalis]|uniref:Signal peptidase I n=1 Tax=Neisseria animalis TaxID=492 RepID=A0A5P3MNJ9_NEIAN|nr:signal peptidase I [Neisseria animalis]QEY23117.1 signal peptidase I [Neisseria animalis]ROW32448.1 signal peptidase I [Neisseria animalis]VEE08170.1 signal peptidase I [Neisseria animalis]